MSVAVPVLDPATLTLPAFVLECSICKEPKPADYMVWHTCGCIDPMCEKHARKVTLYLLVNREVTHLVCDSWHYIEVEKITPV